MAFAFRHQAVALILIIGTKEKRGTKYKSITTLKKLLVFHNSLCLLWPRYVNIL